MEARNSGKIKSEKWRQSVKRTKEEMIVGRDEFQV